MSFIWMTRVSLFWACWIRKTVRKVTMVVPVLMTRCHVSEKWRGPVRAQMTMTTAARVKAHGLSATREDALAKRLRSPGPPFFGPAYGLGWI